MNSYGVGGVGSRHALHGSSDCGPSQGRCQRGFDSRLTDATTVSRSSALPDPALYDTYAREQSPWQTIDPPMPEEVAEAAEFKYPGITGSPRAA